MMRVCVTRCSRVILILLLFASAAWAQGTAQLSGTVRDESGAVLPGVTVTATQTNTGLVRTTVTEASGAYLLTNLPTGPYKLEATLQGFKSYVQTGIVLQVGGTPTVNAVLAVGALEESVTVEAAAPLVDVRSAGISTVVDNKAILELPLQGRQVTDLIVLAGAAVQTGVSARGLPGGVYISVAGGLPFGVAYTLDGAEHVNPQSNNGLPMPFPDALQEFQVATSGLSADNGVKSGASVNAVTKSGTNVFHGDGFEFLRDHRFNSPEHFAAFGPDGKQIDDGLKRNQFGGTLGGPIVRDKLFFFSGYQGTFERSTPTSQISYVPTAQMLAGDFTAVASAECNSGRQITLKAPFVNNRIDPALLSPAARKFTALLPTSTDPCGEVQWATSDRRNIHEPIARIDYQATKDQLFFGRYMVYMNDFPSPWTGPGDSLFKANNEGTRDRLKALVLGQTQIVSSALVNAVRVTWSATDSHRFYPAGLPNAAELGIKMYEYPTYEDSDVRNQLGLNAAGAFSTVGSGERRSTHSLYGFSDDVTWVRGSHQLGFGVNTRYWKFNTRSTSRTSGSWTIDGSITGLSLADFLTGRVASLEIGGPSILDIHNWYLGSYVQDAWRVSNRVTLNAGVRWEPYFGQSVDNNAVSIFNQQNYDQGITSKVFLNAPPGFIYPGDAGFPPGKTGLNTQWTNIGPRAGVAWDVHGDGRLAVRSSYSVGYDFMAGEYHNINAGAPPFGSRSILKDVPLDNPWVNTPGGDPHPIFPTHDAQYIPFGAFGTMNPDINSPRVQQWNVTVEQQMGSSWGVSASYLGSYADRLWNQTALNNGVYLGLGPCTLNTAEGPVFYPVCSTTANLNQRRVLSLQDPIKSQKIGALDLNSDIGWQKYRGLKLAARHRSATGVNLNGTYTLSRCVGIVSGSNSTFNQISQGYSDPANPDFDLGPCDQDRKHLATLNAGYETPTIGSGVVRALVSNWRVSGILNARSGDRLNITSGKDNAFNGSHSSIERPDLISSDIYGPGKTASDLKPGDQILNYFNRAAFAQAAPGTLGNAMRDIAVGPAFWQINLAVSRLLPVGTRQVELRLEAFNVLNHFNWGDPATNFNSGSFGRITTQTGDPRILQLGLKYAF